MPYLRNTLKLVTNGQVFVKLFEPDEAVAKGLALIGNCEVKVTQELPYKASSWYIGAPLTLSDNALPENESYRKYIELCDQAQGVDGK